MVCMGKLTTHVLDTASGIPAAGVELRLYSLADDRKLKAAAVTNDDGRSEHPLLADELLETGAAYRCTSREPFAGRTEQRRDHLCRLVS